MEIPLEEFVSLYGGERLIVGKSHVFIMNPAVDSTPRGLLRVGGATCFIKVVDLTVEYHERSSRAHDA